MQRVNSFSLLNHFSAISSLLKFIKSFLSAGVLVFTSNWNVVYTGAEKIEGKWTWRDGHTIPGEVGSSVWYKNDPNLDYTTCTGMAYKEDQQTEYTGQLVDVKCSGERAYVCSIP